MSLLRAHCGAIVDRGAPATAIHVRDIVKQIYGFAILHGEKVANPADDVGPVSIATFVPRSRSLSPTEIRIMLLKTSKTGGYWIGGCLVRLEANASEHTLYVVHHGERESVEVFKLKAGPVVPTLTWVGCVVYPAGVSGNGVAALPGDAFAASNFMSTNDPKAADKLMSGQSEGGMLIWRPKAGWEDVPDAAAISADNGVAASSDGEQLFVAGWGDETVVRLSLDGTTADWAVIKTGFHTDNLRWGSDGFLYASGQRDTMSNLWACAPNTKQRCTSPFSVMRIDPVTLQTREVVRHPGGPTFGAASTALRIGEEYWLGTPHGDRIAIAPAD